MPGKTVEKDRRRRSVLLATVIVLSVSLIAFSIFQQTHPPASPPSANAIAITHTLTSRNETGIGTPSAGNVFIVFSLSIMDCGYNGFHVAPSLFKITLNGTTYPASPSTGNLPHPLPDLMMNDGKTIYGSIAFEVPAWTTPTIPLSPLTYTPATGTSYNIQYVSDW